jgi:hypothetical protein
MTVVLLLLTLSALIGFGVGTSFRWPAIAASSVGIAVLSSAALHVAYRVVGLPAARPLPGIAIVIACLTVWPPLFDEGGYFRNKPTRNQAKIICQRIPGSSTLFKQSLCKVYVSVATVVPPYEQLKFSTAPL